ncbi:MAG: hypothetical protein V4563_17080 [Pseudomonadota bacterium]
METKPKNQAAQALSALRSEKYSPAERREIAQKAAVKRWANAKPGTAAKNTEGMRAKLAEKRQSKNK